MIFISTSGRLIPEFFLSMTTKDIKVRIVSIVSSEWMFAFLIEEATLHYSMSDGSKFAINSDGMWLFEPKGDYRYAMCKVLKE